MSGCVTALTLMPRAKTGEYNYSGTSLWDSYRDLSLRGSYGHFLTRNWQVGGSVSYSRSQNNSFDDAFNRYRVGGEVNYLIPLKTSATALYVGGFGGYSKATDQDGVFTYGAQTGAKFFVRPDWDIDLGLKAKWTDEEFQDDEPIISIRGGFNPIIGGGLRNEIRQGSDLLFARDLWLVDGRFSWRFNPDKVLDFKSSVGYFATDRFLLGGSVDYQRLDPDNGDSFNQYTVGASLNYHFGSGRLWRPYVGAAVNYYDATEQESVLGYGAQAGVRWWSTKNVTPFVEFGVQNFNRDYISAEWTVKLGITQAVRALR
jgi:hypothetical protein